MVGVRCRTLDLSSNLLEGDIPAALWAKFRVSDFTDNCFTNCTGCTRNSDCPSSPTTAAEVAALVQLYNATNGPSWDSGISGWTTAGNSDPVGGRLSTTYTYTDPFDIHTQ